MDQKWHVLYEGRPYDTIWAVSAEQAMTQSRFRKNYGNALAMSRMPFKKFDAIEASLLHADGSPSSFTTAHAIAS